MLFRKTLIAINLPRGFTTHCFNQSRALGIVPCSAKGMWMRFAPAPRGRKAGSRWVISAAIVGGLHYGPAGLGHLPHKNKNAKEYIAMVSDWFAAGIRAWFVRATVIGGIVAREPQGREDIL